MSLEQQMKILREDIKRQDAKVETDIRTYAELLSLEEETKNKIDELERVGDTFEKFLSDIIGKSLLEAASVQSIHRKEIKEELFQENSVLKKVKERIQKHQPYYTLLRDEDYMELWETGEEKCQRAAIYYAYKKEYAYQATRNLLSSSKKECSKGNIYYLMEKAIIECESENISFSRKNDVYFYIREAGERYGCDFQSQVGKALVDKIKNCETYRCLRECNELFQKYEENISSFEECKESCNKNRQSIKAQIDNLRADKLGEKVETEIQKIKDWFEEDSANESALIAKKEQQTVKVKFVVETLKSTKEKLEKAADTGLELKEVDGISDNLIHICDRKKELVTIEELQKSHDESLKQLQKKLNRLDLLKESIIEEHEKKLEEKIKKKEVSMKRLKKVALGVAFIGIVIAGVFLYKNVAKPKIEVVLQEAEQQRLEALEIQRIANQSGRIEVMEGCKNITIEDCHEVTEIYAPDVEVMCLTRCSTENLKIMSEKLKEIEIYNVDMDSLSIVSRDEVEKVYFSDVEFSYSANEYIIDIVNGAKKMSLYECDFVAGSTYLSIGKGVEEVKISKPINLNHVKIAEGTKTVDMDWAKALYTIELPDGVKNIHLINCRIEESDIDIPESAINVDISKNEWYEVL